MSSNSKEFSIRLTKEEHSRLKANAKQQSMTIKDYLLWLDTEYQKPVSDSWKDLKGKGKVHGEITSSLESADWGDLV